MPGLLELQRSFASHLLGQPGASPEWAEGRSLSALAGLRIYRNNARATFERALELTYPVLQQKVGTDYFRQLAYHFRAAQPSRTGDLHDIGRRFPEFLETHLAGTPYAWLAGLAALEWAVADAGVDAGGPSVGVESLAALPAPELEFVVLVLAPSLRLLHSAVPVLSIWRAWQPDGDRRSIDLDEGSEFVRVHRHSNGVMLRAIEAREFAFVVAMAAGSTLGAALDASQLPLALLPAVLQRLFIDGVVSAVHPPGRPR
jgi:hypothetical protein